MSLLISYLHYRLSFRPPAPGFYKASPPGTPVPLWHYHCQSHCRNDRPGCGPLPGSAWNPPPCPRCWKENCQRYKSSLSCRRSPRRSYALPSGFPDLLPLHCTPAEVRGHPPPGFPSNWENPHAGLYISLPAEDIPDMPCRLPRRDNRCVRPLPLREVLSHRKTPHPYGP